MTVAQHQREGNSRCDRLKGDMISSGAKRWINTKVADSSWQILFKILVL